MKLSQYASPNRPSSFLLGKFLSEILSRSLERGRQTR